MALHCIDETDTLLGIKESERYPYAAQKSSECDALATVRNSNCHFLGRESCCIGPIHSTCPGN
jgi:hypothetical protein